MLIEVHMLQNHAPGNLNRDDTGSPKEAVFGGYKRARISSQCIKRSIRRSELFREKLTGQLGIRTRSLPELVRERLMRGGMAEDLAAVCAKKASGFGTEKGTEQKPNDGGYFRTAQTMFFSEADIEAVCEVMRKAAQDKDVKALDKMEAKDLQKEAEDSGFRQISVDIALFGRMVTSEAFVDVDASCQFAHAISTHKVDHEFDYYTAVDDLERAADDQAGGGADMIGDVEFNSACYYKYFNIHVDGLVDNLTGKAFRRDLQNADIDKARETAGAAARALVEAACRVTPSGKQNSFAAFQLPNLVWIEIRNSNLPVSYANAFSIPVNPRSGKGIEVESAEALARECERLTKIYGLEARARFLIEKSGSVSILGTASGENLASVLNALEAEVRRG